MDYVPLRTHYHTVPPTVTKFGERTYSVVGPSVWNSLPADIRHTLQTPLFYASSQDTLI